MNERNTTSRFFEKCSQTINSRLRLWMKKLVKDLRKAEVNPKVTWSMITEAVSGSREFGAIVAKMPQEDIKRFVQGCLKFNIKKGGEEEVQKGVRQSS